MTVGADCGRDVTLVWRSDVSRSDMAESLAMLGPKRTDPGFYIGNRIRTCISDDIAEAKAVLRRTMVGYAHMPNYRNYWKEAGVLSPAT